MPNHILFEKIKQKLLNIQVFLKEKFQKVTRLCLIDIAKMQFLKTTRKQLALLGILPIPKNCLPLSLQNYQNIIYKIHVTFMLFWLTTYTISVGCLVLFEANTFVEFGAAAFYCSVSLMHLISFLIFVKIKSNVLILMDDLEDIIRKSKIDLFHRIFNVIIWNLFARVCRLK